MSLPQYSVPFCKPDLSSCKQRLKVHELLCNQRVQVASSCAEIILVKW